MTQYDPRIKIGAICAVPRKNGRGRWWVEIIEIIDVSCTLYVKVKANTAFGKPAWYKADELEWK